MVLLKDCTDPLIHSASLAELSLAQVWVAKDKCARQGLSNLSHVIQHKINRNKEKVGKCLWLARHSQGSQRNSAECHTLRQAFKILRHQKGFQKQFSNRAFILNVN